MAIKFSELLFDDKPKKQYAGSSRSVQALMRRLSRGKGEAIPAARKEYARLRKIANKRITRAQNAGDLLDVEAFPETRGINDTGDLAKALVSVKKFLESRESTAAGRKEITRERVEKLRAMGYETVSVDNAKLFKDFMEMWRIKYQLDTSAGRKLTMDSDFAAEIFDKISERFTNKTNKSAMSRYFNDYLRSTGNEDLIVYL